MNATAVGPATVANGGHTAAFGDNATASAEQAVALGSHSTASADSALAVGSLATATATGSIAIGANSIANRTNTLSVGSSSALRQIVNVAAGTQNTDVVNVGQLTPLVAAFGGNAKLNADGSVTGPSYTLKNTTYNNVGDALAALADSSGKYFHANSTLADSAAIGIESIAIGGAAAANSAGDISIGQSASASGSTDPHGSAIAIGANSSAQMIQAVALGTAATASANGDVAIGSLAQAQGSGSYGSATAVGFASAATSTLASALGYRASATGENSVALGSHSVADVANTVSVGSSNQQRRIVNVAAGTQANDAVNVTQLQNVTTLLGGGAKVNADGMIQAPTYTVAGTQSATVGDAITKIDSELSNKVAYDTTDKSHVTLGGVGTTKLVTLSNVAAGALTSTSTDAVNGSQLNSTNQNVSSLQTFATNINNGGGIKYFHSNSTLADSSATGANAVAMGGAAVASADNSVAIGANSVAARVSTVSVGAAGSERQIINVAAGTESTDAVNLAQLTVVSNNLDTLNSSAVKYDDAAGKPNYQSITLGGTAATQPTKLTNVMAADLTSTSKDAVNGSQLFATNTRVGSLETFETNINNGGGIKYFHTNSTLADSSATGADSVAVGGAAVASHKNAVALGSNSVTDRDNSVSVGAAGKERQITNVAAGTASTDAVNLGQLTAVAQDVTKLDSFAVKYDADNGQPNYESVTLGGSSATKPTKLTNLKAGDLNSTSTDAVNGSQLFATNTRVGSLETFETNINNGGGIKYFHTNSALADSSAAGADSVAIGGAAVASHKNAVALGSNSVTDRDNAVSVGAAGKERQITNVAAATASTDAVNLGQLTAVAQDVTKLSSFAVKYDTANGLPDYESVTLGGAGAANPTKLTNLKAGDVNLTSTDAVNGSQLFATNQRVGSLETFETNINNGGGIKYFHTNSKLADSSATGEDSVAIGGAAVASGRNAVALGSNSVADRDNTISVGAAGNERQITNVAAGTASTDAVNVGQLTAVSNNLTTLDSFAVKYDTDENGNPNYEKITLGGTSATAPTLLTNVKAGELKADSTDAVNGSQLYATNQNVATLQDFTSNIANGGGIKYFHSNSTLADSSATGADSVAIGGAAVSSGKNSVALGANSVANRDNAVSVGAAGSERQITNVAAGTATTDAANVGQLNAVSNSVISLSAAAIKYDTNTDGTPDYSNATLGNGNAGTALHNVAAGTSSMDAVNLGQINDMIGEVANLANNAYNPMFSADGNRDTEGATSSGTHSVASGANALASGANAVASGASSVASGVGAIATGVASMASGDNSIASGANASATGANALASGASSMASGMNAVAVGSSTSASADNGVAVGANTSAAGNNGVAVGANASATANNAVALGSGSVADRDNSVSVGSQGNERQITNVAPGTNGTDAVNMNQLQGVQQNVNNLSRAAYSGIAMAGALAGLPQVEPGKSFQLSAGAGAYANYAALAVGASARLTQNTIVKFGASATNGAHVLVNAGVGYSW